MQHIWSLTVAVLADVQPRPCDVNSATTWGACCHWCAATSAPDRSNCLKAHNCYDCLLGQSIVRERPLYRIKASDSEGFSARLELARLDGSLER
jgi:hypothetical protein